MKIEKVNDHQIRCTLTKSDLADRQLKISELAYGTEKAKSLFRDMMQQASYEFGFEAEDIPLMIEAIPLSGDCIVLIITKVEDPDELDTRFSKFAPSVREEDSDSADETEAQSLLEGADEVVDLFRKLHAEQERLAAKAAPAASEPEVSVPVNLTKMFVLNGIDETVRLAHVLNGYYHGENSLYRRPGSSGYILLLRKSDHTPEEFNKVCNIISEYGHMVKYTPAMEAHLEEHGEIIIADSALQNLLLF